MHSSVHRFIKLQDFSYFQNAVESKIRNEQMMDWYNERIEEIYVRIDEPYAGCEMSMKWRD